MELDEKTIRATVMAHAIRLGKCPEPGVTLDFNFRLEEIEREDFDSGRYEKAIPKTKNQRVFFVVTQEDIEAGRRLINSQEAVYSEPKLTKVMLDKEKGAANE